jgi:hypothetical protein
VEERLEALRVRVDALAEGIRELGPSRSVALALWALVVAILGLHASAPVVLVSDMPMDIFVPLDAGWRSFHGQVPHIDFDTPVGRLYYDVYGLAMRLFGADARVILWVPALLAPLVGASVVAAASGRLPPVVGTAVAIYATIMAASPIHLDRDGLVHLASYNRIGWGLVTAVLIAAAIPRVTGGVRASILDGVLCTAVLLVLFYVKITYFALGGAALLLAVAVVPGNRRWALASGVATWGVVGLTFAISEVPWAYVDDIRGAAASFDPRWAQVSGSRAPGLDKLVADLIDNLWIVLLTFGGLVAFSRAAGGDPVLEAESNRVGLAGAGVLVVALIVGVQSHDHHNPALVVGAVVPIAAFVRRSIHGPRRQRDARLALALVAGLIAVLAPRVGRDGMGIVIHRMLASSGEGQVTASDDPESPVSTLRFVAPSGLEGSKIRFVLEGRVEADVYRELVTAFDGADLGVLLRDGAARIREHGPKDARTLTMLFASPFPVVTGAPPPRGTLNWYHPSRTFGGDNPLVPEELLADVDVVLVPTTIGTVATAAMKESLDPWLEEHRRRVDTPLWTLWLR